MKSPSTLISACLCGAILAAGCAATPTSSLARADSAPTCAHLSAEIAAARRDRDEAQADERAAWKAVVPFAVAAMYAKSRADVRTAEDRLHHLGAEQSRLGCAA